VEAVLMILCVRAVCAHDVGSLPLTAIHVEYSRDRRR